MPELPEVETVKRALQNASLIDSSVQEIVLLWNRYLENTQFSLLESSLLHRKLIAVDRRGKFLILRFENEVILAVHLRMSGRILVVPSNNPINKHEHLIFKLSNKTDIRCYDPRKFGRCYWIENEATFFSKLGPEPFDNELTPQILYQKIHRYNRAIKGILLDQSIIAGLGNIYVDEALWNSYIHPLTRASALTLQNVCLLLESIRKVLHAGIEQKGTSLGHGKSNFSNIYGLHGTHQTSLAVYQRTNLPCNRCNTPIQKIIVAQRGTHFCPKCQKPC